MKRLLCLICFVWLGACASTGGIPPASATFPAGAGAGAAPADGAHQAAMRGRPLAALILRQPLGTEAANAAEPGPGAPSGLRRQILYEADLPGSIWERLVDLDDEHAQRRFALLWAGVEAKVGSTLLEQEAGRRGRPLIDLLQEEVESKIGVPSDEALRDLWSTYRHLIQTSFASARPQLQEIWHADRSTQLRQALVDRLRTDTELKLALEVPQLSRHAVRLGNAPRRGAPDGRITVVAFGDYECPYSAQARRLLQSLEDTYPEHIQVVYRDYVLPQHRRGQVAAQAAACAAEQGNSPFWAYYNLLFDNNQKLERDDLQRYAKQAELDLQAFTQCMGSLRPKRAVAQSMADAAAAQVTGSPALFINGMRIQGVLPLPLMRALVDHELAG